MYFFLTFSFFLKVNEQFFSLEFNAYPDVTFRHTFIFEFVTLLTNFYILSSTTKHIRKVFFLSLFCSYVLYFRVVKMIRSL